MATATANSPARGELIDRARQLIPALRDRAIKTAPAPATGEEWRRRPSARAIESLSFRARSSGEALTPPTLTAQDYLSLVRSRDFESLEKAWQDALADPGTIGNYRQTIEELCNSDSLGIALDLATQMVEACETTDKVTLVKITAFREQYGSEFYLCFIAPEDVLDDVSIHTYDEASTTTDARTLISRLAD